MPKKEFDVLVAGEINPDLILSGNVLPEFGQVEKIVDNADLTVGSSSVIFACGAAKLGLKVAFIGVCGNDMFGKYMLGEMRSRHVNVSHVMIRDDDQTGLSVILNEGDDRAILTYGGLISALRVDDIPDVLIEKSRHLHVAQYFMQTGLQPGLGSLFNKARKLGITTSLDTNYDPSETWKGVGDLLSETTIFFPNEREAISLAGESDLANAAASLADKVDILAVKRGASGALGVQGELSVTVDNVPVEVVDTVGAGDSFDAGFIYGYLSGWELKKSLQLGCACGGLSTRKTGGVAGQPTLDEALKYVS